MAALTVGDWDASGPVIPLSFASPKSSTFTTPSAVILMLPGFRSRCTIPVSCTASRASAICRAIANASAIGIRPRAIRSASVGPSTSSSTSARTRRRVLQTVDRSDVWVVERGEHVRLARESRQPLGIGREFRREDLDRNVAAELLITGAIHLPHPARSQPARDRIGPDRLSDQGASNRRDVLEVSRGRRAEKRGAPVVIEEGLDFSPQRLIAGARFREKRRALARGSRERLLVQPLDRRPPFRRHSCGRPFSSRA